MDRFHWSKQSVWLSRRPDRHLQVEAPALACHLDHPVCDCIYLALARLEAAVLLTADQKLMALATQVLP
jgi:predicted nucleic acid-binding protein